MKRHLPLIIIILFVGALRFLPGVASAALSTLNCSGPWLGSQLIPPNSFPNNQFYCPVPIATDPSYNYSCHDFGTPECWPKSNPANIYTCGATDSEVNTGSGWLYIGCLKPSAPIITSISPTSTGAGTFELTINGSNFDSGAVDQVYTPTGAFMGQGAIKSRTNTQIVVVEYMNGVGLGDYIVKVKNSDGWLSNGVPLTITNPPIVPTDKFLTYISPDPYGDPSRVYWIQNNKRYRVISAGIIDFMRSYSIPGWSWQGVYTVSNAYAPAPEFISNGGADVYTINYGGWISTLNCSGPWSSSDLGNTYPDNQFYCSVPISADSFYNYSCQDFGIPQCWLGSNPNNTYINCTSNYINNSAVVYYGCVLPGAPIITATSSSSIASNGMYIRLLGGTDVYKINNGQKEYVSNTVCQQVNCWSDVIDVPQNYLDMFLTAVSPPVLNPIGPKSINEGSPLTFTISGSDPDGNSLTYSTSQLPSGATFDPTTQTFSWTPDYTQAGIYSVVFSVSDGSLSTSENVVITVNDVPAPVLTEIVVGILTIKADTIVDQGGGRYGASGNVNINNFLYVPDGLLIDLTDPENPRINGKGDVSIDILDSQRIQLFQGDFSLDAKEAKLLPAFLGFEFRPMLSIAGFEIVIEELKIVDDIAPDQDPQDDKGVIVSGSFTLPTILWKSQHDKIDISFKGGLSIGVKSGKHFSFGFEVEGVKLGSTGWELKDFDFSYNSATNAIEAKTELKLPVFGIEANLVLKDAALDTIILDVDLSRLPTPIFIDSLPLILSRIAGGVENLQGPGPIQIRAGTGVQTYPRAPITNCNGEFNSLIGLALEPMDAVIDKSGKFTLMGDTYIFKPLNTWECRLGPLNITYDGYHLAQAEGSIDWVEGIGTAKGDLNFIDILVALAQLTVDKKANINGSATGKIQVPKWFPIIGSRWGGESIASNAIYVDNESIRTDLSLSKLNVTVKFTSGGDIEVRVNWTPLLNYIFTEYSSDTRLAGLGNGIYSSGINQVPLNITQPPSDMMILLTWSSGDTDFELLSPSGQLYTPTDTPDFYFKNETIHEAFYLISEPESGEWKAFIYNADAIGSYNIEVLGRNIPPSIQLLEPQEDLIRPSSVYIRWQDEDPDDNAMVSLYYDEDNHGFDGIEIVGNISEDDETNSYLWDTTEVPSGTYYVYAKIDDGHNAPRFSYSQGKVMVQRSGAPTAPANLHATPGDSRIGLTWDPSPESTVIGYRIYFSDNITGAIFEHSLAVGNVTQAELTGLANGRSYRVAIGAYDDFGRESLPSEAQIVSLVQATGNNIPVIVSTPVLITREYQPYTYDVDAQDADNDLLTYQLISAPEGMTIDPLTGLIHWIPLRANAGNNYIEIAVEDGKGGMDIQHFNLFVETEHIPPVTTYSINPPANNSGWHNSAVAVTLSASDDENGSGVKEIHYQLNTNPEVVVNSDQAVVNIDIQGVSLLTFRAVDQAGNKESSRTIELKIDKTPPLLNMPTLNPTYIYNSPTTFNFSAMDALSGIASITATLNGLPISNGDSVILTKPGVNTFTLTATDVAGNMSTQTSTFTVIQPLANSNGSSSYFSEGGYNAYATFDVKYQSGDATPSGSLTFTSSRYRRKIVSTGITSLTVTGKTAVFSGPCTLNGVNGYSFTATVADNATPGSGADTFSITVTGPNGFNYTASGTIISGDYTVSQ